MVILGTKRKTTERNLQYPIDSYINVVARVRYICDDLRLDDISILYAITSWHGDERGRVRRGGAPSACTETLFIHSFLVFRFAHPVLAE